MLEKWKRKVVSVRGLLEWSTLQQAPGDPATIHLDTECMQFCIDSSLTKSYDPVTTYTLKIPDIYLQNVS